MLKRKLVPNKLTKSNVVPPKKKLPKAPIDDDEDELTEEETENVEGEDEAEEEEAPVVKKKKLVRQVVEDDEVDDDSEDEVEEEPLPKKKAGLGSKKGRSALAKAFDSVPLSNTADDIPAGKHECIIREAIVQPYTDDKGQSIRFKYEFCAEPYQGKQMTQWFKIIDANGDPVDWMIDMLKQAFVKLGLEVDGDDLEATIEEIHDTHPGILLKLTYAKGNDGNTYPRFAIQGECNNDVVESYRDSVPL